MMPLLERLLGSVNSDAGLERPDEASTEADDDQELSDAELEEVLGGLERIHFPGEIEPSEP